MTKSSENVRRMVLCAMFTALVQHMNAAQRITPHSYDKRIEVPSWAS